MPTNKLTLEEAKTIITETLSKTQLFNSLQLEEITQCIDNTIEKTADYKKMEKFNKLDNPIKVWKFSNGYEISLTHATAEINEDKYIDYPCYLMISNIKSDNTYFFDTSTFTSSFAAENGKLSKTASCKWYEMNLGRKVCREILAKIVEINDFKRNFLAQWRATA